MKPPYARRGFSARAVWGAGKVLFVAQGCQLRLDCPEDRRRFRGPLCGIRTPQHRRADFPVHLPRKEAGMQDTTVSGVRCASDSGANTRRRFFSRAVHHADEDELLAQVLITSWSLATGRTLRAGAAPHSLTANDLYSFRAYNRRGTCSP